MGGVNFKPELAEKVMASEKTVTRRLVSDNPRSPWFRERCGYRVGQEVAICPGRGKHAIGRARVVSATCIPLGWLSHGEAVAEGFPSVLGFEEAWRAINGGFNANDLVWRIGLEAIR